MRENPAKTPANGEDEVKFEGTKLMPPIKPKDEVKPAIEFDEILPDEAGGVLRHSSPLLADTIIERVRTTSLQVRPTHYPFEPIIGVLFTALDIKFCYLAIIEYGNFLLASIDADDQFFCHTKIVISWNSASQKQYIQPARKFRLCNRR